MTEPHTHKRLCDLAVTWLKRPASKKGPGCQIAFSESRGGWNGEIPDAIGFRAGVHNEYSVVIEVKMSRADFLVDKKKPHRVNPETGMGVYRYFLAPEGLISIEELPSQWGLIEVTPKGTLKPRCGHVFLAYKEPDTWHQKRNIGREWSFLTLMLNRVGDANKVQNYIKETGNLNARLIKRNETLFAQNQKLLLDLSLARNGQAVPAQRMTTRRKALLSANGDLS